jgi:hypothetical protein
MAMDTLLLLAPGCTFTSVRCVRGLPVAANLGAAAPAPAAKLLLPPPPLLLPPPSAPMAVSPPAKLTLLPLPGLGVPVGGAERLGMDPPVSRRCSPPPALPLALPLRKLSPTAAAADAAADPLASLAEAEVAVMGGRRMPARGLSTAGCCCRGCWGSALVLGAAAAAAGTGVLPPPLCR